MKGLIVNADDFGLTAGINAGIVQAHEHGIVSRSALRQISGMRGAAGPCQRFSMASW